MPVSILDPDVFARFVAAEGGGFDRHPWIVRQDREWEGPPLREDPFPRAREMWRQERDREARHLAASSCPEREIERACAYWPSLATGWAPLLGRAGARYHVLCTGEMVVADASLQCRPGARARIRAAGIRTWREAVDEAWATRGQPRIARDEPVHIADADAFDRLVAVEGYEYAEHRHRMGKQGFDAFLGRWRRDRAEIDRDLAARAIPPGSPWPAMLDDDCVHVDGGASIYGFWGWNRYLVTRGGMVVFGDDFSPTSWHPDLARSVGFWTDAERRAAGDRVRHDLDLWHARGWPLRGEAGRGQGGT
jgi:hypothetical protein